MVSDRPNPELQPASTGLSTSDDPSGPSTSDDPDGPRPADDPEGPIPPNEPPADEPPAADDPLADAGPSTARGPHGCACQLTQMCHVFPADLDMCLLVKSYHFPNVPPEHKPKESV